MKLLSRDREFYRSLRRLTLPIAFQSLMLAAVAAADALMLGRLDQDSMAAVSLATQIQFVQNVVISSIVGAGSILGAQYYGKGDRKTVGDLFALMLRLCGICSALCAAGCLFFPRALLFLFTDEPALISIGADYLRIAGFSYLITGVSQCYLAIMRISEHASRSAWISSGAVVLNIVLNACLIFGLGPFPALGARGAAAATLIARIAELLWAIASTAQKGFIRPRLSSLFRRFPGLWGDFCRCALPLLGAGLLWGVGFTSYTAFVGHLGADAAAANSVAAVVRDLSCCLCNGIASAGGILIGYELGRGALSKAKIYGDRLALLSFLIGFFCTALVLLAIFPTRGLIRLNETAAEYFTAFMIVTAVYMIGRCVNTVIINGIFASGGDTAFDMYSLAATMWGLAVPLSALGTFLFHWPAVIVFACTCIDEVGKIPWVMIHYRRYKWLRDLTREHPQEALIEPSEE